MKTTLWRAFTRRAITSAGALLFAGAMVPGVAYPQSCTNTISSLTTYLQANSLNHVVARVASNTTGLSLQGQQIAAPYVTYSAIQLKAGTGWGTGWLLSTAKAERYFSNRTFSLPNSFIQHPFNPNDTEEVSMSVSPAGVVYVNHGSYTHTVTPTCSMGLMYGQVNGLSSTGYLITFERGQDPPVPK